MKDVLSAVKVSWVHHLLIKPSRQHVCTLGRSSWCCCTYPLGPSVEAALRTLAVLLIREMSVSLWKWLNFQSRVEDLNFSPRSKCAQVKTSCPESEFCSAGLKKSKTTVWVVIFSLLDLQEALIKPFVVISSISSSQLYLSQLSLLDVLAVVTGG